MAEYHTLDTLPDDACPERFAQSVPEASRRVRDDVHISFLEACVARCASDRNFDADSLAVEESIDALLAVLVRSSDEIVCCRHVTHLRTTRGCHTFLPAIG